MVQPVYEACFRATGGSASDHLSRSVTLGPIVTWSMGLPAHVSKIPCDGDLMSRSAMEPTARPPTRGDFEGRERGGAGCERQDRTMWLAVDLWWMMAAMFELGWVGELQGRSPERRPAGYRMAAHSRAAESGAASLRWRYAPGQGGWRRWDSGQRRVVGRFQGGRAGRWCCGMGSPSIFGPEAESSEKRMKVSGVERSSHWINSQESR